MMFAVMWEGLLGWSAKSGYRTLSLTVCSLALVAGLSMLRPEFWMVVAAGTAIWIGFLLGKQTYGDVAPREWIQRAGITHGRIVAGNLLAAMLAAAAHLLLALPLVVLSASFWGMPWAAYGRVVLFSLIGACAAASLGLFGFSLRGVDDEHLDNLLLALWLAATAAVRPLRAVNPLLQVWFAPRPGVRFPFSTLIMSLGAALGMASIAGLTLRWKVKRR